MNKGNKKRTRKELVVIIMLLIIPILISSIAIVSVQQEKANETPAEKQDSIFESFISVEANTIIDKIADNEIHSVGKDSENVYVIDKEGNKYRTEMRDDLISFAELNGYEVTYIQEPIVPTESTGTSTYSTLEIIIGVIAIAIFVKALVDLVLEKMRERNAMDNPMGMVRTAETDDSSINEVSIPQIKLEDVYGVDGLKRDIMKIIDYLKDKEKYDLIGARAPKGIIMYGPPGTGKTMLAKAIAGEAGVPCFIASGSDFAEMYVGVGAKRVRELYSLAREHAPSIVFIDEVDAIAGKRGISTNSEDVKTLNALLAELDGFKNSDGVVTICATNRLETLDSAFKRAGRFDLKLAVSLPDKSARQSILKLHAKNKKISKAVKLSDWAKKTPGFSGAELETLLNEAAMEAAYVGHTEIEESDIDDAFYKVILKGNKTKKHEHEEMRKLIAWHEAGHALVTKLLTDDVVEHISIIGSTSGAAGFTLSTPKDEGLYTKKYIKSNIQILLAGRAAEELFTNDKELITTGASNDIERATMFARNYIEKFGMGESYGLVDTTQFKGNDQRAIEEVTKLNNEMYGAVIELLKEHIDLLKKIADRLIENETVSSSELDEIIMGSAEKKTNKEVIQSIA